MKKYLWKVLMLKYEWSGAVIPPPDLTTGLAIRSIQKPLQLKFHSQIYFLHISAHAHPHTAPHTHCSPAHPNHSCSINPSTHTPYHAPAPAPNPHQISPGPNQIGLTLRVCESELYFTRWIGDLLMSIFIMQIIPFINQFQLRYQ